MRSHALEVLALARESETIAQVRFAHGLCSRQMVEDRTRDVAAAVDRLALFTRQETEFRDMLGYLTGDRTAIAAPGSGLPMPPLVPDGLTATLVERRPDVAAAIARVEAADGQLSAVRRDWLPHFGLTATGGTASPALSRILAGGAASFGLGLLAALPVFDGGAHKARVAGAVAAKQLASAQLRDTLLVAYREIHDALAGIAQARSALVAQHSRAEIALAEVARALRAERRGTLSRADLLQARVAELEARNFGKMQQYDAIDAELTLLIALGGRWTS
jgi:multidrug efflux system outer membrane protein